MRGNEMERWEKIERAFVMWNNEIETYDIGPSFSYSPLMNAFTRVSLSLSLVPQPPLSKQNNTLHFYI